MLRRSVVAALVVVALLAACGTRDDRSVVPVVPPPTEVRHDVAPLTSRFVALGEPVSASWVTWNSARPDDRTVPGPTTYWIDAVVRLAPATTAELLAKYAPTDAGKRPDVAELLGDDVPAGPYLTSAALDMAFTTSQLATHVFLVSDREIVVIEATSL